MDFFTDENIIEPLIDYYKDFNYVEYILNLPFESGFKLYLKCIDRIKFQTEEKQKDKIWDMFLIEIQGGYEGNFEDYYKSKIKVSENKTLGKKFRDSEEERIIKDIESKKNIKLKKVI